MHQTMQLLEDITNELLIGENSEFAKASKDKLYSLAVCHPLATEEMKDFCLRSAGELTYASLATDTTLSTRNLDYIAKKTEKIETLEKIIENSSTSDENIENLAKHPSAYVRECVAKSPNASADALDSILNDSPSMFDKYMYKENPADLICSPEVCAIKNSNFARSSLLSDKVICSPVENVRLQAIEEVIKRNYSETEMRKVFPAKDYKSQMKLAKHKDPLIRAFLASHNSTHPSVMKYILENATDPKEVLFAVFNYKDIFSLGEILGDRKVIELLKKTKAGKEVFLEKQAMINGKPISSHDRTIAQMAIASDPATPIKKIQELLDLKDDKITDRVAKNESVPAEVREKLLNRKIESTLKESNPSKNQETTIKR